MSSQAPPATDEANPAPRMTQEAAPAPPRKGPHRDRGRSTTQVRAPGALQPHSGSADRQRRLAEAAYYHAQRRGFGPGRELDDWLEAERELDGPEASTASSRSVE